jgi:hypothetical protein
VTLAIHRDLKSRVRFRGCDLALCLSISRFFLSGFGFREHAAGLGNSRIELNHGCFLLCDRLGDE